ncbi:hypothetical protein DFJ74DRAFT_665485 [Hyaloraphidium curvatum]|nr:hypothetical protein DFJ74DRAFT_665485 [Hyaloraphidium curvatum]
MSFDAAFGLPTATQADLDAIVLSDPTGFVLAKPHGAPDDADSTPAYRSVLSPNELVDGWPGSGLGGVSDVFDFGWKRAQACGKDRFYCYKDRLFEPAGDPMGKLVGFSDWKWTTWAEFNERRLDFGSGLCRLYARLVGGDESQRVRERWNFSLFANNRPEWIVADHGAMAHGIVSAVLFDSLGPDSVEYIMNHSESVLMITTIDRVPAVLSVVQNCPTVKAVISMDPLSYPGGQKLVAEAKAKGVQLIEFAEVEQMGQGGGRVPVNYGRGDDFLTLAYTSGTTGKPKGAIITHRMFMAVTRAQQMQGTDRNPDDYHLSFLPLAHLMERFIFVSVMISAATVCFYRGAPDYILADIQDFKPTVLPMVPRLWNRIAGAIVSAVMAQGGQKAVDEFWEAVRVKTEHIKRTGKLEHPELDAKWFNKFKPILGGRVRWGLSGSAPIAPTTLDLLRCCFSCYLGEGYGQTESGGAISIQWCQESYTEAAYKVGSPLTCNEIKLVSIPQMGYLVTDKPYPRGEIYFRGPNATPGYYKDAEKTAELIDKNGWRRTGDVGTIDDKGRLAILDRTKHIFKLAHGEYVAPERLENIFVNSPYIAQIFVWGDSIKSDLVAVVVPEPEPFIRAAIERGLLPKDTEIPVLGVVTPELEKICREPGPLLGLVREDIVKLGKERKLMGYELPLAVGFMAEPMTMQNGLLTPTNKVKRDAVAKAYRPMVDQLYKIVDGIPRDEKGRPKL